MHWLVYRDSDSSSTKCVNNNALVTAILSSRDSVEWKRRPPMLGQCRGDPETGVQEQTPSNAWWRALCSSFLIRVVA